MSTSAGHSTISDMCASAKAASRVVSVLPTPTKNAVLLDVAERVIRHRGRIAEANRADVEAARRAGLGDAKVRRLVLDDAGIMQLAEGLRQVAGLPDPVGQVVRDYRTESGLRVRRVRRPLGVICMIYEARPAVTLDAFALAFKAGNAVVLKGGREAAGTSSVLAALAYESLSAHGVPGGVLTVLPPIERDQLPVLLAQDKSIDLVIPRGGTELIRFVAAHTRIPTIQHYHGICHIFVDESADLDRAIEICVSAKAGAPATCNAAECVLVHAGIAREFVPRLVSAMRARGVEVRAESRAAGLAPAGTVTPAREDDFGREFLDLIVALKVVDGLDDAISHIERFGSMHTEAILTRDEANAAEFCRRVQSSCTLVNASTRFNDGFQLGLGAEIGISTTPLHAFGPMGLEELTITRFVAVGTGQVR
jgi:glutamate-5-semialdehyde dehydrogenase